MSSTIPTAFAPDAALLKGRSILITGATSGLGRALALECARAGATVKPEQGKIEFPPDPEN